MVTTKRDVIIFPTTRFKLASETPVHSHFWCNYDDKHIAFLLTLLIQRTVKNVRDYATMLKTGTT